MQAIIGVDAILGEPDVCLVAIGVQAVGAVWCARRARPRFVSADRVRRAGRLLVGTCVRMASRLRALGVDVTLASEVEPSELESRPNPRRRPARAARVVIALALAVVTAAAPPVARLSACADASAALLLRLGGWARAYVRREFVAQWRVLAITLGPAAAFLLWAGSRW